MDCKQVKDEFGNKIEEIVSIQRSRSREAIFFMYEDGSTSDIIVGEATHIRIPQEQKETIFESGNVIGSVHTHPAGFDPSTVDIMTAVATNQDNMCVAVPIQYQDGTLDYSLSCVSLEGASALDKRRLFRGMRRSTISFTRTGKDFRKRANLQASSAKGCRTHTVVKDGIEFPTVERPSLFNIEAGKELGVLDGGDMWLAESRRQIR